MKNREVLDIAIRAGEILLRNGAEIYRVEDTIVRICKSYGVACEAFVLPTGMFITAFGANDEDISIVRRIKERMVNLYKVELINSFSRRIEKEPLSHRDAKLELDEISNSPRHSFLLRLASAAIISFAYTILFKGTYIEGGFAFAIGAMIYLLKETVSKIGFFQFFDTFISGMLAAGLSLVVNRYFPHADIYKIIIGSIMILLPGVAITNAIKDALHGDIASSVFRLSEALYVATAVGAGVGVVLSLSLR